MRGAEQNKSRKKTKQEKLWKYNSQSCRQDKVANMLYCRKTDIKVLIKSVQQQGNQVDCGVFVLAFATSLGFVHRPEEIIYDSKSMRQHLLSCLRNKRMDRFPVQGGNTIQRSTTQQSSSCRQPYCTLIIIIITLFILGLKDILKNKKY